MERADGILSELRHFELIDPYFEDPYDLVAKSSFPYEPGRLSTIYKNSPDEMRKKINEETDTEFRRLTNFMGQLDPKNPDHKDLILKWFRMRDVLMELKYGEKGERDKEFMIEGKRFNVGPSEVQHEWKNLARINASVELEISSATIVNKSLPYEAARAVADDRAVSEFTRRVKEGFSSQSIELLNLSDPGIMRIFILNLKGFAIPVWTTTTEPLTQEVRPLLDYTKESKFNFLRILKPDRVYSLPEWNMSKTNGVLRIQMYVEPISH
jgi:hypothetical protein